MRTSSLVFPRSRALNAWLFFAALTIVHTWPIASAPSRLTLASADVSHSAWTMAWIDHAVVHQPLAIFDTNTFWPEQNTLTYAEPMFVPALFAAPVRMLGGSAVLAANVVMMVGLTLTAWSVWFVVARWTGSSGAGLVAGSLAAYNEHLIARLPHAVAPFVWTLPLVLYCADRTVLARSRPHAIWLTVLMALTAATSIYWLALAMTIAGAVAIVNLPVGRTRGLALAAGAIGAGALAAAPILWPYARVAATGTTRPIEMVEQFSATPAGYLASLSRLHAGWTASYFRDDTNVFFAGITAILLAIAGAATAKRLPDGSRRLTTLLLVGAAGVVLSFGPATTLYRTLYEWLTPLRGLRVAARFGYLYLLVMAMLAGYGIAWIVHRWPARSRTVVAVALALITLESLHAPLDVRPYRGVPPIYQVLRELPGDVHLAEVPFFPPDATHDNAEYILNSTAHWRSILNGYSGFTPDSYRRRTRSLWFFPEPWTIEEFRREGATHVMVHLERFGGEAEDVRRALPSLKGLELIAADGFGHLLYRVR